MLILINKATQSQLILKYSYIVSTTLNTLINFIYLFFFSETNVKYNFLKKFKVFS